MQMFIQFESNQNEILFPQTPLFSNLSQLVNHKDREGEEILLGKKKEEKKRIWAALQFSNGT